MSPEHALDQGTSPCPQCKDPAPSDALFCMQCGARLGGAGGQAPEGELAQVTILEYQLLRKVGEGGMGSVYEARHSALGQRVAVKVLHPALARDPDIVQRFVQEARIQVGLRHPNVVSVLTASTSGPYIAMVMEYVDGISLAEVLARRGRLPWGEARLIVRQVLDVVGYAHSRGVVHRDIKPSNIMVTADGSARVMDFGIARVLGADRKTRTGTAMGSAHYMPPEQILGRRDLDHRADIYAFGITLYEMLTGQVPFGAGGDDSTSSDFLVRQSHVQQDPADPRTLAPEVPEHVAVALLRALNKEPDDRFASCAAFAEALGCGDALRTTGGLDLSTLTPPVSLERPDQERPADLEHDAALGPVPGLWRRALAQLVDVFYTLLLSLVPTGMAAGFLKIKTDNQLIELLVEVSLIVSTLYHAEWMRQTGSTPGKRALGLRVVHESGARLNGFGCWLRAASQNLAGLVHNGLFSVLDYLIAPFNHRRRCLHDYIASSVVVFEDPPDQPGDPS